MHLNRLQKTKPRSNHLQLQHTSINNNQIDAPLCKKLLWAKLLHDQNLTTLWINHEVTIFCFPPLPRLMFTLHNIKSPRLRNDSWNEIKSRRGKGCYLIWVRCLFKYFRSEIIWPILRAWKERNENVPTDDGFSPQGQKVFRLRWKTMIPIGESRHLDPLQKSDSSVCSGGC